MASDRYAICRHERAPSGDHYDLFLESGDALRTWGVPTLDWDPPVNAEEKPAHRVAYLEYEGEISGGRGRVAICERGRYEALEWTDGRIRVRLAPATGDPRSVTLTRAGDEWTIHENRGD